MPRAKRRPVVLGPRKLKVTTTVLLHPGQTLQLHVSDRVVYLYAMTPKRKQWRTIATARV